MIRWFPGMGFRPAETVVERGQYGDRSVWIVGDDRPLEGKVPPGWNMTPLPVTPYFGDAVPHPAMVVGGPVGVPFGGLSFLPVLVGGGSSTPGEGGTVPGVVIVPPDVPVPAPVPLPGAGLMLALALGMLLRMKKPRLAGDQAGFSRAG